MVNKEKLRQQWRKAGRKYYSNLKKNRPDMYRHTIEKNTRHVYKHRFGGNYQTVFERDNNRCQICESTKRLIIHHIDEKGRNSKILNNSLNNLILICQSCHIAIHGYLRCKQFPLFLELIK